MFSYVIKLYTEFFLGKKWDSLMKWKNKCIANLYLELKDTKSIESECNDH